MWLCTSPAYDTVHMRSIIIDIRLYMNSGHLSCPHSHTHTQSHGQTDRRLVRPSGDQKLLTRVCLTWYHIRSVTEHSSLCCGTQVLVNTTRATVLALAHGETKTQMLFSLDILFFCCCPSYSQIGKGGGCRTNDYTLSLSFVISQCRLGL